MRLLLVDQYSEWGGAQRCLAGLAPAFAARGWNLAAALPPGPLADDLAAAGAELATIACGPFHSGRKSAADGLRFAAQLGEQVLALRRATPVDAVYVNGPRMMPAASLALSGCPMLFHAHNVVGQPSAAWALRAALRRSRAAVIACSRFVAETLPLTSHPRVIYNGVAASTVTRPVHRSLTVGMLGRIAPEKGQLDFVRAARLVHRRIPAARFVIAGAALFSGAGYEADVRREAADLPVEFRGWCDASEFLAAIDLLAVPSPDLDASPRVVLEAFAAQTPVIAYASGGIPELVAPGCGWLVADRRPEALAAAIGRVLGDGAALDAAASRAYALYRAQFTLERFQSEVCDAIESIAARTPAANVRGRERA